MYSISTTSIVYQNYIFIANLFKKHRAYEWLCKNEKGSSDDDFFLCYEQENSIQFLLTSGFIIQFASGSIGSILIKVISKKYVAQIGFFFIFIGWIFLCVSLSYSKYYFEHKIENNFQVVSLFFNLAFICFGLGSDNSYLPIIYYINERYPVKDDIIKSCSLNDKFNKLKNLLRNKNYILISAMSSLAVLSLFVGNVINATLDFFDFENNIIIVVLIYISLCVIPSFLITNFLEYKKNYHEEDSNCIKTEYSHEGKNLNVLKNIKDYKHKNETYFKKKKNCENNSCDNNDKNNFDNNYEENLNSIYKNNSHKNNEENYENKFFLKENNNFLTNENIQKTNNDIVIHLNNFNYEDKNKETYECKKEIMNNSEENKEKIKNLNNCTTEKSSSELTSTKDNISIKNTDFSLLKKQVTSSFFIFIIIEFFIITFSICFFMFSLFDIYEKNAFGNTLNIYSYFLPSSFIITLIFGFVADIIGIYNFITFNLILGISLFSFIFIYYNTYNVMIGYISLIIYFFHQSFYVNHMYIYMSTIFRDNNFSILIGIINSFACCGFYLSYKIYENIKYKKESIYTIITIEMIISLYVIIFLFYLIYVKKKIYHKLIHI
ncbi:transporter, putative [Plasmodium gallinaceum]|uniref:Transporter, putative n=1 Tax=Plasmodium gallinaceum TaxID=5849 RepID=A0A1J1GSU1_PLAGA|nr:transporter, putative [Plasmodium gallinaceum]CRG95350.1 transporter, putative [Plasmodium gallinaceum]